MHIEAEIDDIHAERLQRLQQRMNKPLSEIVTGIVTRAIAKFSAQLNEPLISSLPAKLL